ncbi:hypothetical protein Aco03nite_030400 [Actinoplanes couchii]|uniref:Uncharacterized protein n=1 Tax=Actinoplanes couchii TaxID=403638 RepID=A0ABQ3X802_9ACTN|nr:hypothetical protein Aco03nite_030400 [Actinoplanes couchii]
MRWRQVAGLALSTLVERIEELTGPPLTRLIEPVGVVRRATTAGFQAASITRATSATAGS